MKAESKIAGVQILRAVLFLGIIAFHCGLPNSEILWGGVEAFFVTSAFFLTKKLIKDEDICVSEYFLKRIKRLYPQYLLTLVGCFCLCLIVERALPIKDLILHLLLLQNFNWMSTGYTSELAFVSGHTWTLVVEIWLFLIWVTAFKLLRNTKCRIMFLLCMLVTAIGYRVVCIETIGDIYVTSLSPIAYADVFAVGSLMAICSTPCRKKDFIYSMIIVVGIALLISCFIYTAKDNYISISESYTLYKSSKNYLTNPFTGNVYFAITLVFAGLLYFSSKLPNIRFLKPLIVLGDISYTGYLIHWPLRYAMTYFFSNCWILYVAVLIVTIVGSLIIDKIIDTVQTRMTKDCK